MRHNLPDMERDDGRLKCCTFARATRRVALANCRFGRDRIAERGRWDRWLKLSRGSPAFLLCVLPLHQPGLTACWWIYVAKLRLNPAQAARHVTHIRSSANLLWPHYAIANCNRTRARMPCNTFSKRLYIYAMYATCSRRSTPERDQSYRGFPNCWL